MKICVFMPMIMIKFISPSTQSPMSTIHQHLSPRKVFIVFSRSVMDNKRTDHSQYIYMCMSMSIYEIDKLCLL